MKFRNAIPIASAWKAICLLHREWGDSSVRELTTFPRRECTIDIHHFGGPYDSHSSTDYFRITSELADYLKTERLVVGKPQWGYRSTFSWVPTDELARVYHHTIAPRLPTDVWAFMDLEKQKAG